MSDISPNSLGLPLEEYSPAAEDSFGSTGNGISPAAWKRVFHHAYSLAGNRGDAEDITQEAFVELFRETESGRPIQHLGAWMRTVTRRVAYRHFHESRPDLHVPLETVNAQGDRVVLDLIDPVPSAEKKVIDQGLLRLGAKVLYQLPEKDRQCIVMYFRGYDFLQIAAILKVSRWTARRTTLKALKKLQTRVELSRK